MIKIAKVKPAEAARFTGHYWHDRLPDEFIARAERVYDRLRGIDRQADSTDKESWIDEFRMETHYDRELQTYIECLKTVAKFERKYGKQGQLHRQAIYYLALGRSLCENLEDAFEFAKQRAGFVFAEEEKIPLMRLIDSCVRCNPPTAIVEVTPGLSQQPSRAFGGDMPPNDGFNPFSRN